MSKNKKTLTPAERAEKAARKSAKEKALREERRREKREGRKNERRLAPIDAIIRERGCNHRTLARRCRMAPQAVYQIFSQNDDCTLATARRLLSAVGLSMTVRLQDNKEKRTCMPSKWDVHGTQVIITGNYSGIAGRGAYPLPWFIRDCPEDGDMAFLAEVFREKGYTITRFSQVTGINFQRVRNMFINDNLRMSELYTIAEALGMKVVLTVTEE